MDGLFLNKYRIESARANWLTYNAGRYFVTICTKEMKHYLGRISKHKVPEMQLSAVGMFVEKELTEMQRHHPYAEVLQYVVMPNHLHAIIEIDSHKIPSERREVVNMPEEGINMQLLGTTKGWLSVAIGSMKAHVTRFARTNNIAFAWQSRFHDHFIRNEKSLQKISEYIDGNVFNWHKDCFYNEADM